MRNHEMQDRRQLSLDRMQGIHIRILMVLHLIITLAHMLATPTHIILMALHPLHLLHREVCLLQPIMGCMDMDLPLQCPLLLNTGVNITLQSMRLKQWILHDPEHHPFILFLHL